MSNHQAAGEVREALRVRTMTGTERGEWLRANWGRLQEQACGMYASMPDEPAAAVQFATMGEKNEWQREQEVRFAMAFQAVQEWL